MRSIAVRLWATMRPDLLRKDRGGAYGLQRDVTPVTAKMEARGILFDPAAHQNEMAAWNASLNDERRALTAITNELPPRTPAQTRDLLEARLDAETLKRLAPDGEGQRYCPPARKDLLRGQRRPCPSPGIWLKSRKTRNSSVRSVTDSWRRSRLSLVDCTRASTWPAPKRAATRPAIQILQQIPARKAETFRNVFVAAPGHTFVHG